ncbi:hypothetical protein ABZP36_017922 [Zizania latifolia]
MATKARAPILLILAALLFAAAATEDRRGDTSLGRCLQRCEEDRPPYERARCLQECRVQQQQQRRREHSRHDDYRSRRDRRGEGSSSGEDEDLSTEQGFVKVLTPFHEASRLLRGIKDYGVTVLEANPRSFVVPTHTDVHCIGYVAQGEGVVATIDNGEKRSYTIRQGDIFVAPAGTVTYLANTDGRRKLIIASIIHTISVPGRFESLLTSFSKHGSHGPRWPLPPIGESHGPFNLLEQQPRFANHHGRLYEADARSFRDLAEHDLHVTLINIAAGSMSASFYNTRSVKITYVLDGEGEAEIVCPHPSSLGKGMRRVYLTEPNSVLKKLNALAKELVFVTSTREVDEILNAQQEAGFVPSPEESSGRRGKEDEGRHRRRGHGEEAIETLLRMAAGAV